MLERTGSYHVLFIKYFRPRDCRRMCVYGTRYLVLEGKSSLLEIVGYALTK